MSHLMEGSKNPAAVLKERDIPEIFDLAKMGHPQHSIAKMYGVSQQNVWSVLKRRTWKHVEIGGAHENQIRTVGRREDGGLQGD